MNKILLENAKLPDRDMLRRNQRVGPLGTHAMISMLGRFSTARIFIRLYQNGKETPLCVDWICRLDGDISSNEQKLLTLKVRGPLEVGLSH